MNKLKFSLFLFFCTMTSASFSADVKGDSGVTLGNEVGSTLSVAGPKSVTVNMSECHFKITLENNQNLLFNIPDVVFYEADTALKKNNLPYLWQAEMSAGYDWAFKKSGNLYDKWFGVMCENSENFSWNDDALSASKQHEEVTPEQQQIRDSNDLKCPAKLINGEWVLNDQKMNSKNYLFKALKGTNWNGFIVGYKNNKFKSTLSSVRFCLVHDKKVIIGASENYSKPLSLPVSFFDTIQTPISTIEFLEDKK